MRILLVYPPTTLRGQDPTLPGAFPPLGLAYIAAVLEENSYEVKILDALALGIENVTKSNGVTRIGISDDDIKRCLRDYEPNVVGVQCMYSAYAQDAHSVARLVKEALPTTIVVMGGAHASVLSSEVLHDKNVDLVVMGEGEITFLEIIKRLEGGNDIFSIQGTVVRKGDEIISNPVRPYVQDLDSIPPPARHLLPMDAYLRQGAKTAYNMRNPCTEVVTSRGCRSSCVFCSIHAIWGHTWRARSPKSVVDEIESLVNKYGIREFHFIDDNVSMVRKRMLEICEEILRRDLDVKWTTPNGTAIYTLDEQAIRKMKQSGCYRLTFGIESACLETQKFIGKRINLDRARTLVKYANNIGIWTASTFIIGFPYEQKDSIMETVNFAVNSDLDFAFFFLPMPFPGTKMTEIYERENLLNISAQGDYGLLLSATGGVDTKYLTAHELRLLQKYAYSSFMRSRLFKFLNPLRIVRKVHSVEDLAYCIRVARNGITMYYEKLRYGSRVGYRPVSMRKD